MTGLEIGRRETAGGTAPMAPLTSPPTADEDTRDAAAFLEQLAEHVRDGQENSALRLIYHSLLQFRRAGRYGLCDRLLHEVNVSALSPVLLIGFLTMTAPIKDRLNHRAACYQAAHDAIREARGPEAARKALVGLE
jgi:hypothetical protein